MIFGIERVRRGEDKLRDSLRMARRIGGGDQPAPGVADENQSLSADPYADRLDVSGVPGDRVPAGKALVVLDTARAELDLASAEKRRAKRVVAAKAARADVKRAQVAVANAEVAVNLARVEGEAEVNAATADATRADVEVKAAELDVSVEEALWQSKAVTSDVKLRQARQISPGTAGRGGRCRRCGSRARTSRGRPRGSPPGSRTSSRRAARGPRRRRRLEGQ